MQSLITICQVHVVSEEKMFEKVYRQRQQSTDT